METCSLITSSIKPSLCKFQSRNLRFVCNSVSDKNKPSNRMFILGFGYVAQIFAQELRKDNWKVSGTCTSTIKKEKLQSMGFDVELFAANNKELRCLDSMIDSTHLLVSIPSIVDVGDPVLYQHVGLLQSQLCKGNLQWLCYLSSTSVYGDCGGAWVDEDYPTTPTKDSSKARLKAEKDWLSLGCDLGLSVQVLRLGGIYGPGRSAVDTIVKKGSLSESQRMRGAKQYTSRIHVHDICQALKGSINKPSSGRIYNVVDDDPASRGEVFAFAEALIKENWPGKFIEARDSSCNNMLASTRGGEKRVLNARLKNELNVKLLYPTYREGLASIVQSMQNPFG
ncbi:hypothetical protein ACHQM5_023856 [Ranunculus cassubicifolius]